MPAGKLKLNSAGVRALLGSAEVQRIVEHVAHGVAGRAGEGAKVSVVKTQGYRVVARVSDDNPHAAKREADTGRLVKALHG